jgi:DNA-binding MarR family transcriptional regulator
VKRPATTDRRGDGFRAADGYAAEHPEADPTATELVINLLEAANILQTKLDQLLRAYGLATGSFNVLTIIVGAGEPITPTEIAHRMRVPVTTATVTGVLDTLEKGGWIERNRHPSDRRRVLVGATTNGIRQHRDATAAVLSEEKRWTKGLSKARRVALADELGVLQTHLRSFEGA